MTATQYSFPELQHAYQVLGMPVDASALAIKQAYGRLVKRWHPDLYATGTVAHTEAMQMIKVINEAYAAIAHAPLRYRSESYTRRVPAEPKPASRHTDATKAEAIEPLNADRIEYWVRFVLGAAAGLFATLQLVFGFWGIQRSTSTWTESILGALAITLAFGVGAARYGDKFWHWMLRLWWLWG